MAQAIDVDELNDALGAYLSENKVGLLENITYNENLSERFTIVDDVTDEVPLVALTIGDDLLKPSNPTVFNGKGDAAAFKARKLKVRDISIDLLITPTLMHKTWLGNFLRRADDIMEMPFEQMIMQEIIAKASEELLLKALYKGVYDAEGAASADTMDGLLTIITNELATLGTPMVATTLATLTESNILTEILKLHDAQSDAMQESDTITLARGVLFNWVTRKFTPVLNQNVLFTAPDGTVNVNRFNKFNIPGTNSIMMRTPGMGTSNRIIMTKKDNLFLGVDNINGISNIRTQVFERSIKIMIDFKAGVQIGDVRPSKIVVGSQV